MSEEILITDANLREIERFHAERAALRQAAQTAGIVLWANGDTYHAALGGCEATGATLGAAIVALCARVAEREVTTRADLDTLRNGVAWLGSELDRVKAWAGRWKRAAKGQWNRAEWWRWRHGDVRRAARLLVVAWREERRKAKMWEEGTLMLISGWEWAEDAPEAPTEPPAQPQGGAAGE
mgnify:CR=1 FL=1